MTQTPTAPDLDLDYSIQDDVPPGVPTRDSQFVFERMPQLIAAKATEGARGRVLDIACGFGLQMERLREHGWETWGLEASNDLARYCNVRFAGEGGAPLVCAIAEELPFRDGSFDRIVCQGSLDHFAQPQAFMQEAARILKPNGRAVIAIHNYSSLSCRLGANLYRLKARLGLDVYRGRNYWQIPNNHTFRGSYPVLKKLGGPHLELVECRGISLLWLFRSWTRLMETLPRPVAWSTMTALDQIAYRTPALADVLVSVWRPKERSDG
jgi:SAM-dependent methyltransferase